MLSEIGDVIKTTRPCVSKMADRRYLVQSLNSPFFRPLIGAEPGRAKEESRITCVRMLRAPPFFPPKWGKNHIWKYVPDLACAAIF